MKTDFPPKTPLIVAEIGKNFIQTKTSQPVSVYLRNAKRLVDAAKRAGADAVKFQTHRVEDEQLPVKTVSPHFRSADRYRWVRRNTRATPLDKFWRPLKQYCDRQGVMFISTPMSRGAAQLLEQINPPVYKIGSGDILDFVLLDFVARTGKPIILSSGMSTLAELGQSVKFIRKKNKQLTLMHCVSQYPCPPKRLNLATIKFLKKQFKLPVGFSDHSLNVESAVAAAALGATVIEKHFTLNRKWFGADHRVSLLPDEFRKMATEIRNLGKRPAGSQRIITRAAVQGMLGRPAKFLQAGEKKFRPLFRKTLVAAADLPVGARLTADRLYAMRPQKYADGLKSEEYESVLGKTVIKDLKKYQPINNKVIT